MPKTVRHRIAKVDYRHKPFWEFVVLCILLIALLYGLRYFFIATNSGLPREVSSGTAIVGAYKGRLPCADCPGIDATLALFRDGTYVETYVYIGKNTLSIMKGTWSLRKGSPQDPSSWIYELTPWQSTTKIYYLIKESQLIPIDSNFGALPVPYNAPLIKQ